MADEQVDAKTETASSSASTAEQTDVTATAAEESSTSQDANTEGKELSLADVVQKAAEESVKSSTTAEKKEGEEKETEASEKEDADAETKASEQKTTEEGTETADELPPFHEHPRWKEVQQQLKDRSAELDAAKPHLERVRALDSFCQENKISSDDLKEALQITALLRQNPHEALTKLKSYTEQVETALGQRLPSDLQKKVDDGILDVDTAKELTALRLQKQGSEHSAQRQQMEAAQKISLEMSTAVNSWEDVKKKSDPDWAKKYPLVFDRYKTLVIDKQPKSAADALALAEEAYKTVSSQLVAFLPKPPAKKVLGSNGSSTKAKPALTLDSMDQLHDLVRSVAARSR